MADFYNAYVLCFPYITRMAQSFVLARHVRHRRRRRRLRHFAIKSKHIPKIKQSANLTHNGHI